MSFLITILIIVTFLFCHHHHQFQKIYHVPVPIPRETDWYVCLACMYSGRDTHLISALQTDTYDQSVRRRQSGYTRLEKCLHRIDAALSCTFDWNMSIAEGEEDRKLSLYTQMTSARTINKSMLASFSCQDQLFSREVHWMTVTVIGQSSGRIRCRTEEKASD